LKVGPKGLADFLKPEGTKNMDANFETMVHQVIEKDYAAVAQTLYEDLVAESGKVPPEKKDSYIADIEEKLKELHQEKLSSGLFSSSQKAMAVDACAETVSWLKDELGLEKEVDTLAWRLGITG